MIWTLDLHDAPGFSALQQAVSAVDEWIDAAPTAAPAIRDRKRALRPGAPFAADAARAVELLGSNNAIGAKLGSYRLSTAGALRYVPGGGYGWHSDAASSGAGQGWHVSYSLIVREPEAGGALELDLGSIKCVIPPKLGALVLFPAELAHRVTPIEAGERIAVTGAIECAISDPFDREIARSLREASARVCEALADIHESEEPDIDAGAHIDLAINALAYAQANHERKARR